MTASRKPGAPAPSRDLERDRALVTSVRDALMEATEKMTAKMRAANVSDDGDRVELLEQDVRSLARGVERLQDMAGEFIHRTRVKEVEHSSPRMFALEQDMRQLAQSVHTIATVVTSPPRMASTTELTTSTDPRDSPPPKATRPALEPLVPLAWTTPHERASATAAGGRAADEQAAASKAFAAAQASAQASASKALMAKAAEVQANVARDAARLSHEAELKRLEAQREHEQRYYLEQIRREREGRSQQEAHRQLESLEQQVYMQGPPKPCPHYPWKACVLAFRTPKRRVPSI